ncbi:MAG: hypothetical protein P1U89_17135 [Verrucomicrobiales bacterium]|nr:hypothetical protein [Verrucomicrobiales bacterium]
MINFLRKHEIWIVLSLILLVNAVFVTSVVGGLIPIGAYDLGRFALLGTVLFGAVFLIRGVEGVLDILRPMMVWKRSPFLYLFAIAWTVVLCLVVLTVKGGITGEMLLSRENLEPGLSKLLYPRLILTLLVSSFIGEMVWVSYAVRRLSRWFTFYESALIVGAVWTAWWLPMAINNFGIIPDLPLIALLFNQMGIAAMCALVYYRTGSGLLVLFMQIMFNATILVFPITPGVGGVGTYWAFALTYFSAATLLFIRFGPRPLFSRLKSAPMEKATV